MQVIHTSDPTLRLTELHINGTLLQKLGLRIDQLEAIATEMETLVSTEPKRFQHRRQTVEVKKNVLPCKNYGV